MLTYNYTVMLMAFSGMFFGNTVTGTEENLQKADEAYALFFCQC